MRITLIPGLPDVNDLDNEQVEKLASLDDHLLNDTKPNEIQTDLKLFKYLDQIRKSLKEVWAAENNKQTDHFKLPNQFGRFQLLELLGEGGQGIVFRAHDPNRDVDVAIKLLNTSNRRWDNQRHIRFAREARITSHLHSAHIATVLEASQVDGTSYIVMPYCHGPTLAQWLAEQQGSPVPILDAVNLIQMLNKAVVDCHSHGILHRDLKPANVLLFPRVNGVPRGSALAMFEPRICDFGLSRSDDDDGKSITGSHTVLGTRAYMAPEQAEGNRLAVSTATDLWALGVILFEMVTGQKPFGDDGRTLIRILTGPTIHPRQLRPDMPNDLEAIILKCLSKSISQRYTTVAAFSEDLELFLEGKPTHARPLSWSNRILRWAKQRPWVAAVAVCFLLGMSTFAYGIIKYAYQLRYSLAEANSKMAEAENSANQLQDSVYAMTMREVTDHIKQGKDDVALKKLITFIPTTGNVRDCRELSWKLMHHQIWNRPFSILPKMTNTVHGLGIGSDRQHLQSEGDNMLFLWDIKTGNSIQLLSGIEHTLMIGDYGRRSTSTFFSINKQTGLVTGRFSNHWSHDKSHFTIDSQWDRSGISGCDISNNRKWFTGSIRNSGLFLHNYEIGFQRVLPWPWLPKVNNGVSWCSFTPDSSKIVVYSSYFQPQLSVCSVEDGTFIGHLDLGPVSNLLALSIEDDSCWCGFDNGRIIQINLNELKIIQEWKLTNPETYRLKNSNEYLSPANSTLQKGVWVLGKTNGEVAISEDKTVFLGGDDDRLVVWRLEGVYSKKDIRHGAREARAVRFSPDSQTLVTAGEGDVHFWDRLTRERIRTLKSHLGSIEAIAFSPDGTTLVTGSSERFIALWNSSNGELIKEYIGLKQSIRSVAISPDGRWLAAGLKKQKHNSGDSANIVMWNLRTGDKFAEWKAHEDHVQALVFTSDSKQLFSGSEDSHIKMWNINTQELVNSIRDAQEVWYLRLHHDKLISAGKANTVSIWNIANGSLVQRMRNPDTAIRALVVSPDGRTIVTGGETGPIRFWLTANGQELTSIDVGKEKVLSLDVSSDGRSIAAGCVSGKVIMLEAGQAVSRTKH